ncbi:MAG: sialate O-acetylesterase, partial [Mangrovibacterium sp.]
LVYDNVLVGEVWLCSGQSNMEYYMAPKYAEPKRGKNLAKEEMAKPDNNMIRVLNWARNGEQNTWQVAGSETLDRTSQVGYFFAKSLTKELDVPVGIVTSAVGGSQIETWTDKSIYEAIPTYKEQMDKNKGIIGLQEVGKWYGRMIEPLIPYTFKGVLWYQGESNCIAGDQQYAEKFKLLADSWRKEFGKDLPIYYVLIAPHNYSTRNDKSTVTAEELPMFWQQQIAAQQLVSDSEYIAIFDLWDNITDIHPPYKWEVADRLFSVAMTKTYGKEGLVWSGPRLASSVVVDGKIIVTFDHVGEGLKTPRNRPVSWFEIAGEDGVFRAAHAKVEGKDKVVVYHPEIMNPSQVRVAWHETAVSNLSNSEGLPIVPFITNSK